MQKVLMQESNLISVQKRQDDMCKAADAGLRPFAKKRIKKRLEEEVRLMNCAQLKVIQGDGEYGKFLTGLPVKSGLGSRLAALMGRHDNGKVFAIVKDAAPRYCQGRPIRAARKQ